MSAAHQRYMLCGVMGWPVGHSRSPLIHQYWMAQKKLRGAYVLLAVEPQCLESALRSLSVLGFVGCNLTIPHKVAAMQWVDHVDPLARRIGAINTVVVQKDASLKGYNTDGVGFIRSLLDVQPTWRANAGPACVIGAGGAARAVVASLIEQGAAEIRISNRSDTKAHDIAREFGCAVHAIHWEDRHDALHNTRLLVNTTNQGMHDQPALDLHLQHLPQAALVCDIVYTPLQTPLLRAAKSQGNTTVSGLGMLLHQARAAFEAWVGILPDITPELINNVTTTLKKTT